MPGNSRMIGVEHDEIRPAPHFQHADRATSGAGAAFHGGIEETVGDVRLFVRCQHVTLASRQPLSVFQQAQLGAPVDGNVAVRAEPEASTVVEKRMRGENAIAEIRFGCQAQARDGATRGHCANFVVVNMRGVHEAPAFVHIEVIEQPAHGPRFQRVETGVDFSGLLGGKIDVTSAPGLTRFTVRIPVVGPPRADADSSAAAEAE